MNDPTPTQTPEEKPRALTIRQPWASLIACGAKTIETRSWPTKYRGPLLIHAGKSDRMAYLSGAEPYATAARTWGGHWYADLWPGHFGAVLAVAELVDVVRVVDELNEYEQFPAIVPVRNGDLWLHRGDDYAAEPITAQRPLGDFAWGNYGWLLANVRPLPEPIPAKGRQGLWKPNAELLAALDRVVS